MSYEELIEHAQSVHPGVITGQMFGMPCLKLEGKALGGKWRDDIVFKLSLEHATEALTLPEAHVFEPMEGHAMKQWIVVPRALSREYARLIEWAIADRLAA